MDSQSWRLRCALVSRFLGSSVVSHTLDAVDNLQTAPLPRFPELRAASEKRVGRRSRNGSSFPPTLPCFPTGETTSPCRVGPCVQEARDSMHGPCKLLLALYACISGRE